MKADLVKGHLSLVLLGVLSNGPAHGYAVITALRDSSNGWLELTEGAVYPALHKLEAQGHVASEWHLAAGRRRRIYRITPAGRGALGTEHSNWRALVAAVERVLDPAVGAAVTA